MNDEPEQKPEEQPENEGSRDPLDGALSALQGILERRHVVPGRDAGPTEGSSGPGSEPENLPLLDDVVIPGTGVPVQHEPHEPAADPPAWAVREQAGHEAMPPYDDLIKRLASEVDVIIEECVEEALDKARKELVARIKSHLDIVMPEILEELSLRRSRDRD